MENKWLKIEKRVETEGVSSLRWWEALEPEGLWTCQPQMME